MTTTSKAEKFKQLVAHFFPIVKRHRNGDRLDALFSAPAPKEQPRRPMCKVCNNEVGSDDCRGWKGSANIKNQAP